MNCRARLPAVGAVSITVALGLFACAADDEDAKPPSNGGSDGSSPSFPPTLDAGDAGDARAPFDAADEAVTCTVQPCVTQLVAGSEHFCALLEDKTVRCWGYAYSALGTLEAGGAGPSQPRPVAMGLSGVEQISAGQDTTCARSTDGSMKCWGANASNELGFDPPAPDYDPHDPTPVVVAGGVLDAIARVDVGPGAVFAVKLSGELWSWGDNATYTLGRPSEVDAYDRRYLRPGPAIYLAGVSVTRAGGVAFEGARSVAFALTTDRRLLTWGTSPQLVAYPSPLPVVVAGLENVSSAEATGRNICAVADGQLHCWGDGLFACTGSREVATRPVAIKTHGTAPVQQVKLGDFNTCVRLTDGTLECCGRDTWGQLGTGDTDAGPNAEARILTPVSAFTGRAVQIAVGSSAICALTQGGTVQCWGSNDRGQLGQGTVDVQGAGTRHSTPVTVAF